MGNNLIHNYLNTFSSSSVNEPKKKSERSYFPSVGSTMKSFDKESDKLIKPLDGKGHLINHDLIHAPKEYARDAVYTTKALADGIRGKANDHQLGTLNDLGLRLSGLAIATYLMTKKATPRTKAMEFIGFGAFLASMALWPKIALEIPARIIHGFNFRQQYIDEQGRKKFVSQDPNYIPFDLYNGDKKSHDLDVIGDRAGIKRNIPNRHEAVKDHMRKVSVQNNTLWMLTAGIATPIMTALACNQAEKYVTPQAEKYTNKKVNKQIDKLDNYLSGALNKGESTRYEAEVLGITSKDGKTPVANPVEKMISTLKNKVVKKEQIVELADALADGFDPEMKDAARADITDIIGGEKYLSGSKSADLIGEAIHAKIAAKDAELAARLTTEELQIAASQGIVRGAVRDMLTDVGFEILDKNPAYKNSAISTNFKTVDVGNIDFFAVTPGTENMTPAERLAHNIKSVVLRVNNSNPSEDFVSGMSELERTNKALKEAIDSKLIADADAIASRFYEGNLAIGNGREQYVRQSLSSVFKQKAPKGPKSAKLLTEINDVVNADVAKNRGYVISDRAATTIVAASKKVQKYNAIDGILSSAAHFKVEQANETLVANNWNEVSKLLVDELHLTPSELSLSAKDAEYSRELLLRKLSDVVSGQDSYSTFMTKLGKKMAELDEKMDAPNEGSNGQMMNKIEAGIKKNCTDTARELEILGMPKMNMRLVAKENGQFGTNVGSIMTAKMDRLHSRVEGVHSAYMRILQCAEFLHREKGYRQRLARGERVEAFAHEYGLTPDKELNEELLKRGKELLFDAHTDKFYTKMGLHNNHKFFERLMRTVYRPNGEEQRWDEGWAKSTNKTFEILDGVKLDEKSDLSPRRVFEGSDRVKLGKKLKEHMNQVYNSLGSIVREVVDPKTERTLVKGGVSDADARACKRFDLLSKSTSELFHDTVKRMYNSKKWTKTFAPILGVTTAVTILAQFFFGKKDSDVKA